METDFLFVNDFSIILLIPQSEGAREWVNENLALESWQNSEQVAIEPRYFGNIYEGIVNEGFLIAES